MVELSTSTDQFLALIKDELPKRLPPYTRTTPQQRSREMQRAAFGEARKVTEDEYQELIGTVRKIRAWLQENGVALFNKPDDSGTEIPVYSCEDSDGPIRFMVMVILKPHEQSAGMHREPYPKFSLEQHDESKNVCFDLNFNDTYSLSVKVSDLPQQLEIDSLNRRKMTKPEHDFVMETIGEVASHFRIPIN